MKVILEEHQLVGSGAAWRGAACGGTTRDARWRTDVALFVFPKNPQNYYNANLSRCLTYLLYFALATFIFRNQINSYVTHRYEKRTHSNDDHMIIFF